MRHRHLRLGERAEIREHFDANAVGCPAIGMRGRAFDLLALLTRGERLFGGSQRCLIRRGREIALLGVEDQPRPFRHIQDGRTERHQRRNAHRGGEDRDVRSRAAGGQADAGKPGRIERNQLRGLQVFGDEDRAFGQVAHDDRRFAIQREQHLRFEIEQIVDALAHPRIAEGPQCIGAVAYGATPRKACALAARDRTTRRCDQFPIVEKLQVGRDHFACRPFCGRGDLFQARAHRGTCSFELLGLVCDAFAGFGDLHFGVLQRHGTTDGKAAARDHAAQTVRCLS